MLQRAAVKVSLTEPKKKFLDMLAFMRNFGTNEVHLVHVRTKTNYREREKAETALEELGTEINQLGMAVDFSIRNGYAPGVMTEVAATVQADYLALYWKPKALLRHALLGSIDSDILRMSNMPVFMYNPKLFRPVVELESVLYATDFQFTDAVVMPYLKSSRFKARTLYLLHVGERAPDPDTEARRRERALTNLERLAEECAHAYDQVEVIETLGLVRNEIVRQAKAKKVNLIVAGKSDKPNTMSRLVGSTAEVLPHRAHCSVFIIPNVCGLPRHEDTPDQAKGEADHA
ncbi:MAG: universal stress protein [Desulfovibrio sp.]